MKPSNDNSAPAAINAQSDAVAQPPFKDGHAGELIADHLGDINFNSKDGFGNAQWDARNKKNDSATTTVEDKIPPAF